MQSRGYGRIVNIGSINGQAGQYGQVNYAAAKSGIHGFTKALAQEGARNNVTVNAIAPGYIDTDMAQSLAGMPLGIEAELFVELLQIFAEHRHFLRRHAERFAGPKPGMNAYSRHRIAAKRHDDEVERYAAVHGRLALSLGHQGDRAALLQIIHAAHARIVSALIACPARRARGKLSGQAALRAAAPVRSP